MKKIYELWFVTTDGKEHNLLYGSKRRAEKDMEEAYSIGSECANGTISNVAVFDRILF